MSESKEIVNWEERLAQDAKAVAALERPAVSAVSLRSGVMSINDQPVPGNRLPCVVVAAVFENVLYTKQFDPNVVWPPDCFAQSLDGKEMHKHEVCADNEYGPACETCDMFKWGSDTRRPVSKGKACKERRKLAILPATAIADGEIMKAEMAILSVPVTSVRNWGNFVNSVAAEYGRPFWAMLTEISVHPHVKNQFEVRFAANGVVSDKYLGDLSKRVQAGQELLMQPYDLTPPVEQQPPQPAAKSGKKY